MNRKTNSRKNRNKPSAFNIATDSTEPGWGAVGLKAFVVSVLAIVAVLVILRGGKMGMNHFFYENPSYSLTQIIIETDGVLNPSQLQEWAGVARGDNLLALDFAEIKSNFDLIPWIRSTELERVFPNKLRIKITERQPIAKTVYFTRRDKSFLYDKKIYYIDKEGFVLTGFENLHDLSLANYDRAAMPTITGLDRSSLQIGKRINSENVQAALELVSVFRLTGMYRVDQIDKIDIKNSRCLVVTTRKGSQIQMAPDHFEKQLSRWRAVQQFANRHSGISIASLDLSLKNNCPVRWNVSKSNGSFRKNT